MCAISPIDPHPGIRAFARSIVSEPRLGLVFHKPEQWATCRRCFENVWDKIKGDGGMARYGWTFLYHSVEVIPNAAYISAGNARLIGESSDSLLEALIG